MSYDNQIKSLRNEVSFLKSEIQSKNSIIMILANDRKLYTDKSMEIPASTKKYDDERCRGNQVNEISNVTDNPQPQKNDEFISNQDCDDGFNTVNYKRKNTKRRNITILGDSLLKGIQPHKLKNRLKPNEKLYVKSFAGATIADLKYYARHSQRFNPDLFITHIGCNELRSTKTPEVISDEIVKLAK